MVAAYAEAPFKFIRIITLCFLGKTVLIDAQSQASNVYYGKFVGSFRQADDTSGDIYAADSNTLLIVNYKMTAAKGCKSFMAAPQNASAPFWSSLLDRTKTGINLPLRYRNQQRSLRLRRLRRKSAQFMPVFNAVNNHFHPLDGFPFEFGHLELSSNFDPVLNDQNQLHVDVISDRNRTRELHVNSIAAETRAQTASPQNRQIHLLNRNNAVSNQRPPLQLRASTASAKLSSADLRLSFLKQNLTVMPSILPPLTHTTPLANARQGINSAGNSAAQNRQQALTTSADDSLTSARRENGRQRDIIDDSLQQRTATTRQDLILARRLRFTTAATANTPSAISPDSLKVNDALDPNAQQSHSAVQLTDLPTLRTHGEPQAENRSLILTELPDHENSDPGVTIRFGTAGQKTTSPAAPLPPGTASAPGLAIASAPSSFRSFYASSGNGPSQPSFGGRRNLQQPKHAVWHPVPRNQSAVPASGLQEAVLGEDGVLRFHLGDGKVGPLPPIREDVVYSPDAVTSLRTSSVSNKSTERSDYTQQRPVDATSNVSKEKNATSQNVPEVRHEDVSSQENRTSSISAKFKPVPDPRQRNKSAAVTDEDFSKPVSTSISPTTVTERLSSVSIDTANEEIIGTPTQSLETTHTTDSIIPDASSDLAVQLYQEHELPESRDGMTIIVHLPEETILRDFKWIGVYDNCHSGNDGRVSIPAEFTSPREAVVPGLKGWVYDTSSGDIHIMNCNTLLVTNFTYFGGEQEGAYFFVGFGEFPQGILQKVQAFVVGESVDKPLGTYRSQDVLIRLPESWRTFDVDWLTVFNPTDNHSYAYAPLPKYAVPPCENLV